MFDGPDFPISLDESTFEAWLEEGRQMKMGYNYLLVLWDAYDEIYLPKYIEDREKIFQFEKYENASDRESLVAAYDLYSESKIA